MGQWGIGCGCSGKGESQGGRQDRVGLASRVNHSEVCEFGLCLVNTGSHRRSLIVESVLGV